MTFLPDHAIHNFGERLIKPFYPDCVEPASVDLHLSTEFAVPDTSAVRYIDLDEPQDIMRHLVLDGDGYVLHPGDFILGVTEEFVTIPDYIVGKIEGKSSLGRLGLMVHVTAGFIDPGFNGCITLEMKNLLNVPIVLRPGKKICQIAFAYLNAPCDKPYQGRYQDSKSVVASKYGEGEKVST